MTGLLIVLAGAANACTPLGAWIDGFSDGVDGATDVQLDAGLPIVGNSMSVVAVIVDAQGDPGPDVTFDFVKDYYGEGRLMMRPVGGWAANTTYSVDIDINYASNYPDQSHASATFTTGDQTSNPPVAPVILDVQAGFLGTQTNDCVVGTHQPRDIVLDVEVEAEPWSWIQVRNDDLRVWVTQPVSAGGTIIVDAFQPVMDDPGSDSVECFTTRLMSPSGEWAESDEFCIPQAGVVPNGTCSTGGSSASWWAFGVALLALRRRSDSAPR